MDYGFPQILSALSLKQYIKAATVKDLASDKGAEPVDNNKITSEITGAIDWRQPGKYKYKKNEVYIDILESVNLLMSSDGNCPNGFGGSPPERNIRSAQEPCFDQMYQAR